MLRTTLSTTMALACVSSLQAQVVSDDFDSNSSALYTIAQTADAAVTFQYDYSAMGIPPAPNSSNTTIGVKFEANMTAGAANAATMHTLVKFTGDYAVKFDAWVNANGPFPGGGRGSTEFITCGVGGDGTVANIGGNGLGAWFAATGEGGSSRDYRGYKDSAEQFAESGQFSAGNSSAGGGAHNASDPYYAQYGSIDVGALPVQGASNSGPAQQNGTSGAGTFGFAWHEVLMVVDADGGTGGAPSVAWFIDGRPIATLDAGIGSSFKTDGTVAIGYMDSFSSVSDNASLSFGVIDNLRIGSIATSTVYGSNPGHPTFGTATLAPTADPIIGGNAGFALNYAASGAEPGIMVVGINPVSVPFLGGTLLVNALVNAPLVTTPSTTNFSFPVPNDPTLVGADFYLQCAVFDTVNPQTSSGLVFSDGLHWRLGN